MDHRWTSLPAADPDGAAEAFKDGEHFQSTGIITSTGLITGTGLVTGTGIITGTGRSLPPSCPARAG
ncbi:hypothetical protein GCM10027271_15500 [Saccharopolyspora gloriosae]